MTPTTHQRTRPWTDPTKHVLHEKTPNPNPHIEHGAIVLDSALVLYLEDKAESQNGVPAAKCHQARAEPLI